MKKVILITLGLSITMALSACGNTSPTNSNSVSSSESVIESSVEETIKGSETNVIDLVLEKENSIENYADFSLFKIWSSKRITPAIAKSAYENDNNGETYVDMILDITNTSTDPIEPNKIADLSVIGADGTEYTDSFNAVETDNGSDFDSFDDIVSLSTVRLHCIASVPEKETDVTLKLVVNEQEYNYNYTLGTVVSNAKELNIGDTIEEPDYATLVFNGIEYTDDLLPSNTNGAYSHYQIDNASNTFLVVKFDITNYTSNKKDCDSFVGVKALYMDKYTYTGTVVIEDEDGGGFSSYEGIDPLTTRHIYCLIKVPKTVIENDATLTISFNGKEFTFTGK